MPDLRKSGRLLFSSALTEPFVWLGPNVVFVFIVRDPRRRVFVGRDEDVCNDEERCFEVLRALRRAVLSPKCATRCLLLVAGDVRAVLFIII